MHQKIRNIPNWVDGLFYVSAEGFSPPFFLNTLCAYIHMYLYLYMYIYLNRYTYTYIYIYICAYMVCIYTYIYIYRTLYPLQPCVRCSFWVIGRLVVRPCRRLNCPLSRSACWWKQLINHFILSGISTDTAIEHMLLFSIKWYQMVRSRQKIFTWLPEALGRGKLAEGSRPGHALESHGVIIDSGWEGFLSSSSQTRQSFHVFF